jgi:hypothetical protein
MLSDNGARDNPGLARQSNAQWARGLHQSRMSTLEIQMAEVLVTFTTPTKARNGDLYYGRVLGRAASNGLWEGRIEFELAGSDEIVMTDRETEQPNRTDLNYWAQGLSATYLEGALERALRPAHSTAPGMGSELGAGPQTSTADSRID